ncbi:MAG: MBL fold metallo-hydrolase [Thermodesulfovibrionales bacterium]|nr:MBL fold metallo-hydrolase [Thermodesulfovibrionales bacterium]
MKIQFLGGVRTVTGSCFYIRTSEIKMLVDCGMFQGEDSYDINRTPFLVNPSEIDYLFLTHAHIDHSGLIPKLVKDGFSGKIVTTSATADLAELMLYDSAHIQEADSEWHTRRAMRAGKEPVLPLYTVDDVKASIPFFKKVSYGKIEHTGKGIKYRFLDAGHILGSGSLEIWFQDGHKEKKIIFSGDIGRKGNPIINDPSLATEAEYVVMESTYGNRLHKGMSETIDELVEVIKVTFKKGGNVIIPAFAIGRTQDLLYVLNRLVREGRLYKINVYIDSPLAEQATKTYLAHPECFDDEAKRILNAGSAAESIRLRFTGSVDESIALNKIKSHAIIIAGSGMCEGGRIGHHLKHNLWRPECSIIFSGFQARGTLGRRIVDGARVVRIFGEEIAMKAGIYTLGGFSAHADQKELLEWLASFKGSPQVFVVHGEEETSLAFSGMIKERYRFVTHVPSKGEEYEI